MKKLAFNLIVFLLFTGCGNDDFPERTAAQREFNIPFNDWDTPPDILHYPTMDIPTINYEGDVQIGLQISGDGTVDSVWVQLSSTYEELDSLAIATALRMTFTPAIKDETPVSSQFVLPFQFRKSNHYTGDSESSND